MADNIGYTPGTGATVAADDVSGVLYQRIKIDAGADGASAPLAFGQALMAASIPVTIASNQGAVPVSGTVTANLGTVGDLALDATVTTGNASLANIDADLGAPADAAWSGTGNATAIAALKGIWSAITNNALPTGSNTIGTVNLGTISTAATAANQSTTNTALGAPADAAWAGSGSASLVAGIKGVYNAITASLPAGTNSIGQVTANAGTNLNTSALALDATLTGNNQRTRITDGTNIAAVKAASTPATATDPAMVVDIRPGTTITVTLASTSVSSVSASATAGGHTTPYTGLSLATTAVTQIKASNANIASISIANGSAGTRWVKVFLLPSASVTMGTTPCSFNYRLAAGQSRDIVPSAVGFRSGAAPNTGLSFAVTSGQGLADNTATSLAAGDVEITVVYT